MTLDIYVYIAIALFFIGGFAIGYGVGRIVGAKQSLHSVGVLTGDDARRFHERMEEVSNYVPTPEEVARREELRKTVEAILKKANLNN